MILDPDDPLGDILTRRLMVLTCARLAAGYTAMEGRHEDADRWARLAFEITKPPVFADA